MNAINKHILGIVYKKTTGFWTKIDYLVSALEKYSDVTVKLIEVSDNNKFSLPNDLDIVTMIPSETDLLPEIISKNKNLRWVHSMFAGVDKFVNKKELLENDNIMLTNAKGAYANSLAEFTMFAMLYHSFNAPLFLKAFSEREWVTPLSMTLRGKTLSIVGYGLNGIAIAKRAKHGFNMNVIGVKKDLVNVKGKEYIDEVIGIEGLDTALAKSDFVVSMLPHTNETVNLFDYKRFQTMKDTSVFINLGRGTSVNEDDLIKILKERGIKGACLDVFHTEPLPKESGFYGLDNVFISCHSADNTDEYFKEGVDVLLTNLDSYIKDGKLISIVDKQKGY
jgi:phosphoglycerate dehydrogenase-like enzyme